MALVLFAATLIAAPGVLEGAVVYVVDGDTIHVRVGERVEKVRYIGVNAPEVPHPGQDRAVHPRRWAFLPHTAVAGEAARRINLELVAGQRVRLELDREQRDDYGLLLAYVWV